MGMCVCVCASPVNRLQAATSECLAWFGVCYAPSSAFNRFLGANKNCHCEKFGENKTENIENAKLNEQFARSGFDVAECMQ